MKNKTKIWMLILVIVALPIAVIQYLNFTGFCYSEMQYFTKRELVDRYLYGDVTQWSQKNVEERLAYIVRLKEHGMASPELVDQWLEMSTEEQIKTINELRQQAPRCCQVGDKRWGILNDIFGEVYYEFDIYHEEVPPRSELRPYTNTTSSIDTCGNRSMADDFGSAEPIGKESFQLRTQWNIERWKGEHQ